MFIEGGLMTGLAKLGWGRVWIMEILFQIAEEYDCMVDGFRFMPTDEGQQLLFNVNGNMISCTIALSEIENCSEEGVCKDQMFSSRAKIRHRLRELLMFHKRNSSSVFL